MDDQAMWGRHEMRQLAIERELVTLSNAYAPTHWGERLRRVGIRLARIATGAALGVVGLFLYALLPNIGSVPLASLTLAQLVLGALGWMLLVWLAFMAWFSAFGARPTEEDVRKRLRERAGQVVDERFRIRGHY